MKAQTLEKIEALTFFSFIIVSAIGIGIYIEASSFIYMRTQDPILAEIEGREISYSRGSPAGYIINIKYYPKQIAGENECRSSVFSKYDIKSNYIEIVPQQGSCYRPYIYNNVYDTPDILPPAVALLVGAGALLLWSTWHRYRLWRGADAPAA